MKASCASRAAGRILKIQAEAENLYNPRERGLNPRQCPLLCFAAIFRKELRIRSHIHFLTLKWEGDSSGKAISQKTCFQSIFQLKSLRGPQELEIITLRLLWIGSSDPAV